MDYQELTRKKRSLDRFRPLPPELMRNLDDWFRVELTYTSNAIEGNTLTRRETALVIEQGLTVGGKSLKDHLEAVNHAHGLDFIRSLVEKHLPLSAQDVLALHALILKGDGHAGSYRRVPVRISGSTAIMPNPQKVPDLMDAFHDWLVAPHDVHPVAFAGEAHYRLVTIHPFIDGNGRTARLLMNLILMMQGYPPAIIRKRDRLAYLAALERAQTGGSKAAYETLIAKAAERSLDIYLKAAQGESASDDGDSDDLLKIGKLAKAAGVTVPTIRYWTSMGLLKVSEVAPSGYQLYTRDMVERCETIQALKRKRMTLAEIKKHFR